MEEKVSILKRLKARLDELSENYKKNHLSDREIAIFNKFIAYIDIHFSKVREKNKIDQISSPDMFLRLVEELDRETILFLVDALPDITEDNPIDNKDSLQTSLSAFTEPFEQIDFGDNLRPPKLKVIKKGLNGHS